MQKRIKEEVTAGDKSIDLTELEIGFLAKGGYYLIERPLAGLNTDQMVEFTSVLLEYALEKQAKDSIQE